MSHSKSEGTTRPGSAKPAQAQTKTAGGPPQGSGFLGPKGDPSEGKREVGTKPKR